MTRQLSALAAISLFTTAHAEVKSDFHQPEVIRKITFGSCSDPRRGSSPMFEAITKLAPDIFVFLGDNIYGDTEDMELLLKKWNELGDIESFLLKKLKAHHTFAISGDVHFAELSKLEFQGYPFYDLTGSGMTNTSKDWASAKNSFRVGESYPLQNAGHIEIAWANKSVGLAIINKDGEKILNHPLKFSALEFE